MYNLEEFITNLEKRNQGEPEFIQAVREVLSSVIDVVNSNPVYLENRILERITEPDRVIEFKVEWEDDNGKVNVNRGYRVQFNNAIGPYKGGLRFAPNLTLGTLKFLGFEQTFKNSLTTLPMGGGKGGADFNPTGKSDKEILRFCRSFMTELYKYIGPDTDVPAGDLGVGGKEIGYLYGQWKKIKTNNESVLTGKGRTFGGSLIRPEATGFGAIYFTDSVLSYNKDSLDGKTVIVSGFGNVAWGTVMKATELGAKVIGISGPDGYVIDKNGISTKEKFDYMLELRSSNKNVVKPYADKFKAEFYPNRKIWEYPADIAFTCALQNELNGEDAKKLIANKVKYVMEVSNMGCTADAVDAFYKANIPFGPGKAVNAGGVAVSGLEMSQNSQHISWSSEEVNKQLQNIMKNIFESCIIEGKEKNGFINYVKGANIAGFKKVADAMVALGY